MQKNEMMNLIQTAKDRDPDAFTTLMQQYMKDMYRVAIAILMHDEDAADAIRRRFLIVGNGSEHSGRTDISKPG